MTTNQCYQWRKPKTLPYKHAIADYGSTKAYLPSLIAYGGGVGKTPQ